MSFKLPAITETENLLPSQLFVKPEVEPWQRHLEAKAAGIGIALGPSQHGGPFAIQAIIPDGAAAAAGIEADWLLVAIDGRTTRGMPLHAAVDLIRGLPWTRVVIDIENPLTKERRSVELERQFLTVPKLLQGQVEP